MRAISNALSLLLVWTSLAAPVPAAANDMVCVSDLNGNGYAGEPGETAVCNSGITGTDSYCPIGAVQCDKRQNIIVRPGGQSCPAGYTSSNGQCQRTMTDNRCDTNPAFGNECRTPTSKPSGDVMFNLNNDPNDNRYFVYWEGAPNTTGAWKVGDLYGLNDRLLKDGYLYWAGAQLSFRSWEACRCATTQTIVAEPVVTCPTGSTYNPEADRCEEVELVNSCPLDGGGACVETASGQAFCSFNPCMNISDEVEIGDIDGGMLVDNGSRDETGACMDQVLIFSGRASECLRSGVSTGFNDCCDNDQEVSTDSMGSLSNLGNTVSTIKNIYQVTAAAGSAYTSSLAAGGTQAAAADAAVAAAQTEITALLNPATIAWAIALYVILDFLMQACDQSCVETAMAAESGFCHEVGTYCKKEWLGSCVQRAKSYCCFNSMMARIVHEQGRPQLKNFGDWGEPESPDCRGFTPEEFRALDFSQIDMSEYYDELVYKTQQEIGNIVEKTTGDYFEKIK